MRILSVPLVKIPFSWKSGFGPGWGLNDAENDPLEGNGRSRGNFCG